MNVLRFAKGNNMKGYQLGLLNTVFLAGFIGIVVLPFYIYMFGAGIFWEYLGIFVFMIIVWNVEAYRLMRYSRISEGIISLPGFFSARFDERKGFLRILSSTEIIVISLVIAALMLKELNLVLLRIFEVNFDMIAFVILMISAAVIGRYGMEALARSAMIKATIFVIAMLSVGIYMYSNMGILQLIRNMMQTNITGSVSEYLNIVYHNGRLLGVNDYISLASVGLLASGMPFLLSSFFTVSEAESISSGKKVSLVYSLLLFLLCAFVGGVSRGFLFKEKLTDSLSQYICYVYKNIANTGFAGRVLGSIYFIAVVLALIVGIEGTISVLVTIVYEDILRKGRLIRVKKKNEKWILMAIALLTGIAIFILGQCITYLSIDLILVFIATLGCSISPTVFMALVWKRMNRCGCVAGLVSGLICVPAFKYIQFFEISGMKASLCDVMGINSIAPSTVISFAMIVIVSLLTKKESKEVEEEFLDVRNRLVD